MESCGYVCSAGMAKTVWSIVSECVKIKAWFRDLGNKVRERIDRLWSEDMDSCKGNVIKRLCKEREKRIKNKGKNGNTEEDRMIALDPEEEKESEVSCLAKIGDR